MTEVELLKLIEGGENIQVEFKKSTTEITKDVYDTVCSFSNRDGGTIVLGVKDNGEILGIAPDAVDRMKKDFVTSINNGQKINPPLYLRPETYTVNGRTLLVIQVPSGSQVCRHHGRIFDRSHEADIDITDNSDMVYQLYARKSGSYFVNKVTRFQMEDLRPDLIERARAMTASRTANHPWKSLSDEELLRSAGLILKDPERQLEGITLAAILLFGKDSTILSVLPQHKTDAIFRVENVDRYDDRDVIITNLLETYDRLIAFGQKHLSDPFVQVAMGADPNQTLRAIREAESYNGPSIVICYCPCIEHGMKASMGLSQLEKKAVECGYWHLYRYDPRLKAEGKNPFTLDSKAPTGDFQQFLLGENRYASLKLSFPEKAQELYEKAERDAKERLESYLRLAEK